MLTKQKKIFHAALCHISIGKTNKIDLINPTKPAIIGTAKQNKDQRKFLQKCALKFNSK